MLNRPFHTRCRIVRHLVVLVSFTGPWLLRPCSAQSAPELEPLAGHSAHGETFNEGPRQKPYVMSGCGDVHLPIRCERKGTQAWVRSGCGPAGTGSGTSKRREIVSPKIAALEPGCSMAYWGMAMANVDNPDRAAGFIVESVRRRAAASARGRLWIDALASYYEVDRKALPPVKLAKAAGSKPSKRKFKKSKKARSLALVRGYEAIIKQASRRYRSLGVPRQSHLAQSPREHSHPELHRCGCSAGSRIREESEASCAPLSYSFMGSRRCQARAALGARIGADGAVDRPSVAYEWAHLCQAASAHGPLPGSNRLRPEWITRT